MAIVRHERDWGIEIGGFGRPFGLGIDRSGCLHVTDMDRHCVVRFDETYGTHEVLASPGWRGPHSIDFAPDGRAVVTCYYQPGIYVVGDDQPLPLGTTLSGPASSFFDHHGCLLIAEYSQSAVMAVALDGGTARRFAGEFDRPHMARALDNGRVIVADTWNNRLQTFDANGQLLDDSVATVSCPVAVDPDAERGWLVTAWGDNAVLRFDTRGRPAGRLDAPALSKPYDARWLSGGRVAVADSHHGRVLVLESPRFH